MSQSIEDLADEFRPLVVNFLARLDEEMIEFQILWTTRSKLEQAKLYSAGRTEEATSGFTRNRAGDSFHNFGMAIDIVPISHGRIDLSNKAMIETIGKLGKECGLVCGGDFLPTEPQHFQMPGITLEELKTGKRKTDKSEDILDSMVDGQFKL